MEIQQGYSYPVIEKYLDHVHTIQEKPVTLHKELNRVLTKNLNEILAMHNRGIDVMFTDVDAIRALMEEELQK